MASSDLVSAKDRQNPFSCLVCQQRKVKCNRHNPCATCKRTGASCVYTTFERPKRRIRAVVESNLIARLQRCEELLASNGIQLDPCEFDKSPEYVAQQQTGIKQEVFKPGKGRLVKKRNGSRYLENNLWDSLSKELPDSADVLPESEDESEESTFSDGGSLLLELSPITSSLTPLHPQPAQIFRLWQVFLDNVDPLTKVLHIPSVQKVIVEASANLSNISKSTEALLFSMYSISIVSIADEDCERLLGEPRSTALRRYEMATQRALTKAKFLISSDIVVLQAFLYFLVSIIL
jgi:hypothetical protein